MSRLSKKDQRAKISATEARRRKEVALARLREMEADQRAGKLIPSDQVKDAWVKILSAIKAGVLRMPDKLAPALAATSDAREAQRAAGGLAVALPREPDHYPGAHAGP